MQWHARTQHRFGAGRAIRSSEVDLTPQLTYTHAKVHALGQRLRPTRHEPDLGLLP